MQRRFTLKSARVTAGLSQIEAAKKLGIAVTTLRNWEQGATYPKYPDIENICNLYEIPFDQIDFV